MRNLIAAWHLLCGIGHLLRGAWTIASQFPKADAHQRSVLIAQWARGLLSLFNVQTQVHGQPLQRGPLLVVSNHISWLDILVLLTAQPVCFVAKAQVKQWPLIGWLATHAGTLYIERASRKDAMRVVHRVAQALEQGQIVAIFPEGTTSAGRSLLPFHANLLQAAISTRTPVQAVALRYIHSDGQLSPNAPYIDDDTLLRSVWRMLRSPPTHATLNFLDPLSPNGLNRRTLAAQLQANIAESIG